MPRLRSASIVAFAVVAAAARLPAQVRADSNAYCDSVVAAAVVDSVDAALYLSVKRADGGALGPEQTRALVDNIGAAFILPQPLRLAVFEGPARLAVMRPTTAEHPTLRPPTITGVYRATSNRSGVVTDVGLVRSALWDPFDAAAMSAIHDISSLHSFFVPPDGTDSMEIDVRFSTDSVAGGARLVSSRFPRMSVVDAAPLASNPMATFPRDDSTSSGEVVLRFVVDRSGEPRNDAVEAVRATSMSFLRAALGALADQRFTPASIRGCRVAQLIDYPFTFVRGDSTPRRH